MDFKQITIGDLAVLLGIVAAAYTFYKMIKEIKKPREEKEKKIEKDLSDHKVILDKHEGILNEHIVKLDKIDTSLDNISDELRESSEYTKESDTVIKLALCSMQRQTILNTCERYIRNGFATLEQKDTISSLYDSYHALGGNGFLTKLYNQVMELPISKDE